MSFEINKLYYCISLLNSSMCQTNRGFRNKRGIERFGVTIVLVPLMSMSVPTERGP